MDMAKLVKLVKLIKLDMAKLDMDMDMAKLVKLVISQALSRDKDIQTEFHGDKALLKKFIIG